MPNVFSGTFTRRFLPHFSRVGQHRGGIIHFGLIRLSRLQFYVELLLIVEPFDFFFTAVPITVGEFWWNLLQILGTKKVVRSPL